MGLFYPRKRKEEKQPSAAPGLHGEVWPSARGGTKEGAARRRGGISQGTTPRARPTSCHGEQSWSHRVWSPLRGRTLPCRKPFTAGSAAFLGWFLPAPIAQGRERHEDSLSRSCQQHTPLPRTPGTKQDLTHVPRPDSALPEAQPDGCPPHSPPTAQLAVKEADLGPTRGLLHTAPSRTRISKKDSVPTPPLSSTGPRGDLVQPG